MALHEQDHSQASGTTYHYHLDHLGTPRELTDTDGRIVWSARYRAYGNLALADVEAIDNPLRFQGQYFDAETGLHYNLNRYYDPNAGRFIHQGPIGLEGGNNLYQYVPNPINWADVLGLACAELSSFPRLNEGKVYRVIRNDENPLIGLYPKNPGNIKSVAGHITSGSRSGSQFISATKDYSVAEKWAKSSGNRIVEIDLSKVNSGAIDVSSQRGLELLGNNWARRLAKGSSEVLFDNPIPPDAINLL